MILNTTSDVWCRLLCWVSSHCVLQAKHYYSVHKSVNRTNCCTIIANVSELNLPCLWIVLFTLRKWRISSFNFQSWNNITAPENELVSFMQFIQKAKRNEVEKQKTARKEGTKRCFDLFENVKAIPILPLILFPRNASCD